MSKERLIELIGNASFGVNKQTLFDHHKASAIEEVANCLLASEEVIVLPCKVKEADSDVLWTAETIFDAWNNVTGAVCEGTSWYYELKSVIEDIVKLSFGAGVLYKEAEAKLKEGKKNG